MINWQCVRAGWRLLKDPGLGVVTRPFSRHLGSDIGRFQKETDQIQQLEALGAAAEGTPHAEADRIDGHAPGAHPTPASRATGAVQHVPVTTRPDEQLSSARATAIKNEAAKACIGTGGGPQNRGYRVTVSGLSAQVDLRCALADHDSRASC